MLSVGISGGQGVFAATGLEKEYDEVTIGSARVVAVDIKASNGVIHVIDEVLLPKS